MNMNFIYHFAEKIPIHNMGSRLYQDAQMIANPIYGLIKVYFFPNSVLPQLEAVATPEYIRAVSRIGIALFLTLQTLEVINTTVNFYKTPFPLYDFIQNIFNSALFWMIWHDGFVYLRNKSEAERIDAESKSTQRGRTTAANSNFSDAAPMPPSDGRQVKGKDYCRPVKIQNDLNYLFQDTLLERVIN